MSRASLPAVILSLLAAPAGAQQVSGSISMTAPVELAGGQGQYTAQLSATVGCSLACPPSAPTLSYAATSISVEFAADQSSAPAGLGFGEMGQLFDQHAFTKTVTLPAGSNLRPKVRGLTCQCGGHTGEGGYISPEGTPVALPTLVYGPGYDVKPGDPMWVYVYAAPRDPETVTVTASGAGVSDSRVLKESDFSGSLPTSAQWQYTPTEAGTVSITATFAGASPATIRVPVLAGGSAGTGGGTDGGSGSAGGAAKSSGGCNQGMGVPGVMLALMSLLGLRRRGA